MFRVGSASVVNSANWLIESDLTLSDRDAGDGAGFVALPT